MLKRPITYEDLDGNQVTEIHYFNMSKAELLELEVGYKEGFGEHLQKIAQTNDRAALVAEFKKLILMSYGVRSDDGTGKRFIKNDKLREEFEQTGAYSALFMELATNDKAAAEFVNGVVPKDISNSIANQQNSALPPPPPNPNQTS